MFYNKTNKLPPPKPWPWPPPKSKDEKIIEELQDLKCQISELKKEQKKANFINSLSDREKQIFNEVSNKIITEEYYG